MSGKLEVLNCLVFDTPHSFWVESADELKADPRFSWLGYGDWSCTLSPDISDAICRKHDVAFASLQKFAGVSPGRPDGNELDEAWKPRNKALADAKFSADILLHACQDSSTIGDIPCSIDVSSNNIGIYWVYTFFVAYTNSKGWPVTEEDIDHINFNYNFVEYGDLVPSIVFDSSTFIYQSESTYDLTLRLEKGCVKDIAIEEYEQICITAVYEPEGKLFKTCSTASIFSESIEFGILLDIHYEPDSLTYHLEVYLKPSNRKYGGGSYYRTETIEAMQE